MSDSIMEASQARTKKEKEASSRYCDYLATYCDVAAGKTPMVSGNTVERNLLARSIAANDWRQERAPLSRSALLAQLDELCPATEPEK